MSRYNGGNHWGSGRESWGDFLTRSIPRGICCASCGLPWNTSHSEGNGMCFKPKYPIEYFVCPPGYDGYDDEIIVI